MNKWLVLLIIFFFSLNLRIWNLNQMGQGWDEHEYIEQGYKLVELIKKGDFNNPYFYNTYDHPPLVKYLYGITAHLDVSKYLNKGEVIFNYDYTYSRLLSSVISSLAIGIMFLFAWKYISPRVAFVSGIILSMLPFFLGFSQLVTTESLTMLIFTSVVFAWVSLLDNFTKKKLLLTGLLLGLAIQVKQSNILLLPLMIATYIIWMKTTKIKFNAKHLKYVVLILGIALATFVVIWPQGILNLSKIYSLHKYYWNVTTSPPEIFFGNLMLTPIPYYFVMFAITTPILILFLFLSGLSFINKQTSWILFSVVAWFFIPFIQSFYPWRQHGVRYIIEIYAPLTIISAVGFDFLTRKLTNKNLKINLLFIPVVLYMFITLVRLSPYYLDYFNAFVGGTKGVYQNKSFQIGWWGQGVRSASIYILKNLPEGSRVGVAVSPIHAVPVMKKFRMENFNFDKKYDYVLINYYSVLREQFNESKLKQNYYEIYRVNVDGAVLAKVYKSRN